MGSPHEDDRRRGRLLVRIGIILVWLLATLAVLWWQAPGFWRSPTYHIERAEELASAGRFGEAREEIGHALRAGAPADVATLSLRGYLELEDGDPHAAVATFRRAREIEPRAPEIVLGLATALQRTGEDAEARRALTSLDREALGAAELRRRAQLWVALDAPERALEDLESAVQLVPEDPALAAALLEEALALAEERQDWRRAESYALRLAAVSPSEEAAERARRRAALALRQQGELERAKELLGPEPESGSEQLRKDLAWAFEQSGRDDEAERQYRLLASHGMLDQEARVRFAWLLNRQRRHAEAWRILRPLPRPASDPEIHLLQARTAAWAGDAEAAVPLLESWIADHPNDASAHLLLAEAWRRRGRPERVASTLRHYVRLRPDDVETRTRLARMLSSRGAIDAAIVEYRELLRRRPGDTALLRELGVLLEAQGRWDEALRIDLQAAAAIPSPPPELALRIARLSRWSGRAAEAVTWYQRVLETSVDDAERREATAGLAASLLDTGRTAEALEVATQHLQAHPEDADVRLLAATAATELGEPAAAARHLTRLARQRPLTADERHWRIGQLLEADRRDEARTELEAWTAEGEDDPQLLELAGDLAAEDEEFELALAHYRLIPVERRTPEVWLGIGRTAARVGELDLAIDAHRRALDDRSHDVDARLALARLNAEARRFHRALEHYRLVVEVRGDDGLELELARAALGAERFEEAERWARQAHRVRPHDLEARIALAQSLHLQGRLDEADELLRPLLEQRPDDADALAWLGRTAAARDRHLEAYRLFSDAASRSEAPEAAKLWLEAGDAATKREDFAHAESAYRRAGELGVDPLQLAAARRDLSLATSMSLGVPLTRYSDSNDLELGSLGAGAVLWAGRAARIEGEALVGEIAQDETRFDRRAGALSLSHVFPRPALQLAARAGIEDYDDAGSVVVGQLALQHAFAGGSTVGAALMRESLWSGHDRRDPRLFNRVIDLAALGPDFRFDGLRAFWDAELDRQRRLLIEGGARRYEDDNRHAFVYAHLQLPLSTAHERWAVLRPNLYFETFSDRSTAYFSPDRHATLGAMYHSIQGDDPWRLEFEVNPQLLWTDDDLGWGGHAALDLTRRLGGVRAGAGLFAFYDDNDEYLSWRLAGRISFGRGGVD